MHRKQQSEAKMNADVVKALNKLPRTLARKRRGGPYNNGLPDVSAVSHGVAIEIEGKLPGNSPTDLQMKMLRDYTAAGAICGVYYCVEDALSIVKSGLKARGIDLAA